VYFIYSVSNLYYFLIGHFICGSSIGLSFYWSNSEIQSNYY